MCTTEQQQVRDNGICNYTVICVYILYQESEDRDFPNSDLQMFCSDLCISMMCSILSIFITNYNMTSFTYQQITFDDDMMNDNSQWREWVPFRQLQTETPCTVRGRTGIELPLRQCSHYLAIPGSNHDVQCQVCSVQFTVHYTVLRLN